MLPTESWIYIIIEEKLFKNLTDILINIGGFTSK